MNKLKEILVYILNEYPHKSEMSNARLTKLVYLSDWHHALHNKSQISPIKWYFDNYGPFVWDVFELVKSDESFKVDLVKNYYGNEKKLISLENEVISNLSKDEKNSVNKVIEATKSLNWDGFIKMVYSTYPILTSDKYSWLNLIEKSQLMIESKTNK